MVKKKSILKKIFGKSKVTKDAKNSSISSGGVATSEEATSPIKPKIDVPAPAAAVEEPISPSVIPQVNGCDTTLDTESDGDDGSPRSVVTKKVEMDKSESLAIVEDAPASKSNEDCGRRIYDDTVPEKPVAADVDVDGADVGPPEENVIETVHTNKEADVALEEIVAAAYGAKMVDATDDDTTEENITKTPDTNADDVTLGESVAVDDIVETVAVAPNSVAFIEKNVPGTNEAVSTEKADKKAKGEGGEDTDKESARTHKGPEKGKAEDSNEAVSKDRRSWAEQRMSQMYASSSKMVEKSKVEVEVIGKLSDRMKAVEQALHNEKDKGPDSLSKEASSFHGRNREKAAAQRKAIEDRLRRQSDPKVYLDRKSTPSRPPGKVSSQRKVVEDMLQKELNPNAFLDEKATPTSQPGKVSSQRQVVEEMLQKELDPQAFLDSHGKANPQSPGKERLASKKKWVMETLEKQNDPKSFVDQKERHFVDMSHENFGQKKDFDEHKKWLDGMAHSVEKEKENLVEDKGFSATS